MQRETVVQSYDEKKGQFYLCILFIAVSTMESLRTKTFLPETGRRLRFF